jgi:hypothetical protein
LGRGKKRVPISKIGPRLYLFSPWIQKRVTYVCFGSRCAGPTGETHTHARPSSPCFVRERKLGHLPTWTARVATVHRHTQSVSVSKHTHTHTQSVFAQKKKKTQSVVLKRKNKIFDSKIQTISKMAFKVSSCSATKTHMCTYVRIGRISWCGFEFLTSSIFPVELLLH